MIMTTIKISETSLHTVTHTQKINKAQKVFHELLAN